MKKFDWPFDLGIIRHCTNDGIWEDEMSRHPSLPKLADAVSTCTCGRPDCEIKELGRRKIFQKLAAHMNDSDLLTVMQKAEGVDSQDRLRDLMLDEQEEPVTTIDLGALLERLREMRA